MIKPMKLTDLYRYPVKSLGTESLQVTNLYPEKAMPGDRQYAFTHGKTIFDTSAPCWTPCKSFLRIASVPELAAFTMTFDLECRLLRLGLFQNLHTYDLSTDSGRLQLLEFIKTHIRTRLPEPYDLVELPDESLSDSPHQAVSIGFMASLHDLEEICGQPIDLRRFRMNLWIQGGTPWREFNLVGRKFCIGDIWFQGIEAVRRCMAPAANPETGKRDLNPKKTLLTHYGHGNFGILAKVLNEGEIRVGDDLVSAWH